MRAITYKCIIKFTGKLEEIRVSVSKLKCGKAAGMDFFNSVAKEL